MRTIKQVHKAEYAPIADLITYNPLPNRRVQQIDPFIFLNHHGPQTYAPHNSGLPFGPHPHRGMETVTFILDGDIMHKDSGGHASTIGAGGVQYMTAGSGLIHAETSSPHFKEQGGKMEILQLWLNLPARLKMTEPYYKGLQKDEIPTHITNDGKVTMNLISGEWMGIQGALETKTDVRLATVYIKEGGKLELTIPQERNIFFYIIRGKVEVNGQTIADLNLVEFANDGDKLAMQAQEDSILLLGDAMPFNEPMVAQGPFVMNTQEEIMQAYDDFRKGKFGTWRE